MPAPLPYRWESPYFYFGRFHDGQLAKMPKEDLDSRCVSTLIIAGFVSALTIFILPAEQDDRGTKFVNRLRPPFDTAQSIYTKPCQGF